MRNIIYFRLKHIFICVILIINQLLASVLDSSQISKITNRYEEIIDYWEKNGVRSNSGYIITEKDDKYHEICLNYTSICQQEFKNIPDGCVYCTEKIFRDYYILIKEDLGNIYLSKTTDFENSQEINIGEEVKGLEKWFLTEINEDSIKFNYGWLYPNAWFAESLIDMYYITGKEKYLLKAEKILELTCKYLDSDGKWYRFTALDEKPIYIAQRQSIFIRTLYKLMFYKQNNMIRKSLEIASRSYEHTDEGVYNHWTNSRIGGIIRDRFLGVVRTDYNKISEVLEILYKRIRKYEGKIPYGINENNSQFPDFKETYQTYDTYLLSLLSYYSAIDIGFDKYFDMAFEESIDKNSGPYLANNLRAVLYLYKSYGIRNDEFVLDQINNNSLYKTYNKNRDIVGQLQALVAILHYNKLTKEDALKNILRDTDSFSFIHYPNPFNSNLTIQLELNHRRKINVKIYDLNGKRIRDLTNSYYKSGVNKIMWNGKNNNGIQVGSGVYIYRILIDNMVRSRKINLIK